MKCRKMLSIALACASALIMGAQAASGASDAWPKSAGGLEYGKYGSAGNDVVCNGFAGKADGDQTRVEIPKTVNLDGKNYTVVSIGRRAFVNCTTLEEISLPETVVDLGMMAFAGCANLSEINLPDKVTEIPLNLMDGCASIETLDLPPATTVIQNRAFAGMTNLNTVTLPDTLETIADDIFADSGKELAIDYAGTPLQWEEIETQTPDRSWFGASSGGRRATVTCSIPEDEIMINATYAPKADEWTADVTVPVPDTWTLHVEQFGRVARGAGSARPTLSVRGGACRLPMDRDAGEVTAAHVEAVSPIVNGVLLTASSDVRVKTGWTPQDIDSWVTMSTTRPAPGEQVSITLRPETGDVHVQLISAQGHGNAEFRPASVNDTSRIALSADGQNGAESYTYAGTAEGDEGDKIRLRLQGTFHHDLGSGSFDTELPVITITKPAASPSVDPQPSIAPSASAVLSPDPEPSTPMSAEPDPTQSVEPQESTDAKESPTPKESVEPASRPPQQDNSPESSVSASIAPSDSPEPTATPETSAEPSAAASEDLSSTAPSPSPSAAQDVASPSPSQSAPQGSDSPGPPSTVPTDSTPAPSDASVSPSPDQTQTHAQKQPSDEPGPGQSIPALPRLTSDSNYYLATLDGTSMILGAKAADLGSAWDVGQLRDAFEPVTGVTIEIVDHDGHRVLDHMPLATGYEVVFRLTDTGDVIGRIPIVVQGDVCGIGYMNLTQLVRMSRCYVGKSRLIGCYFHAGDFDRNGRLDLTDLVTEAGLYRRVA